MWLVLWSALAFAGKWDGRNADIVAERTILAEPEAVFAKVAEPNAVQTLFPADCADWSGPFDKNEVGGKTIVTYTAGAMMRRLDITLKRAESPRVVDYDHAGNKGFVTRFQLAPVEGGTKVTLTTFLNPPPKLVQGYFYKKVQPAWQGCHERTLANLDSALGTTTGASPEAPPPPEPPPPPAPEAPPPQ
jgi:hypothetical protein